MADELSPVSDSKPAARIILRAAAGPDTLDIIASTREHGELHVGVCQRTPSTAYPDYQPGWRATLWKTPGGPARRGFSWTSSAPDLCNSLQTEVDEHGTWWDVLPDPPGDGKIFVQMPGTGVVADYASQRERDQSVRLAQARHRLAERTGYIPAWGELGEDDRETAALEARNWLRAMAMLSPFGDGIVVSGDDLRAVLSVLAGSIPGAMLGRFREALGESGDG